MRHPGGFRELTHDDTIQHEHEDDADDSEVELSALGFEHPNGNYE